MQMPPNYGPAYVREFEALFADVAKAAQGAARAVRSSRASAKTSRCSSPTASIRPPRRRPKLLDNVWPALQAAAAQMNAPSSRHGRGTKVGIEALREHPDRIDVRSPVGVRRWITCRARSTCRCSTTASARKSARCTRRSRRFARQALRRGDRRAQHRDASSRRIAATSRANGRRSSIAGAAASAARSLAHVLNEIGWRAVQLEGGYRT